MRHFFLPLTTKQFGAALLGASLSLLICGCNLSSTATPSGPATQALSGKAIGGNGPLGGSSVKLYLAGTTGYGSSATLLASTSTSTDGAGSFSFNPSSYTCPTGGQVYVLAQGGDPQGGTGTSNPAISLLASLGTCGSLSPFVVINEASTVINIYAAAQFFNATTESFGTPATPQAQQGLVNAFQLASSILPGGTVNPAATYTPSSSVAGVTMTATPETAKISSIADILAACVNSTDTASTTSSACSDLFNAAIAPPEASSTSGSTTNSGAFPAATDTLMAAYYLAINPGLLTAVTPAQTINSTGDCASDGGKNESSSACLFSLISGIGAPFAPTIASVPNDWTLSVAYSATGTCSNTGAPLTNTWHGAVDAQGNVWMINDSVAGAANTTQANYAVLSELGPTGNLQQCLGGNLSGAQGVGGRDVTIDTAGNIWASTYGGSVYPTANSGSTTSYRNHIYQYIPTTGAFNSQANFATGLGAYYMTADGLGNVFVLGETDGGTLNEFPAAATDTGTANTPTTVGTLVSSSTTTEAFYGIQADTNGNVWISNQNSTTNYVYEPSAGGITTFSGKSQTGPYNLVIDANNDIVIAGTCCAGTYANIASKMVQGTGNAAAVTQGPVSTRYAGGLSSARSMAVDGANNTWASSAIATDSNGDDNIVELDANLNGLSPNGTPTGTCPGTTCLTNGGYPKPSISVSRGVAIDGSGNVWVFSSSGTKVTQLIGAAVPVVTPLSTATKYAMLGKEPTNLSYAVANESETAGTTYSATATFGTNSPTPTGTITFTPARSGTPTCTLASSSTAFSGTVTCAAANSTLAAGTYIVNFTYSGDSNYAPASATTTLTVQ